MKNLKYLPLFLFLVGCSSIAFNKTPELKEEEASRMTFEYPKKDVFDACVGSLEANGWTVTAANYETGAISGVRRQAPDAPPDAEPVRHAATVSVVEQEPGRTEVKITAGISLPNPSEAQADPVVKENMPKLCLPLLNSVQETLLKAGKNP